MASFSNEHRMLKKAALQGHSERRGEAYFVPYVEPLSNARTPLAAFLSILLCVALSAGRITKRTPQPVFSLPGHGRIGNHGISPSQS